MNFHEALKLFGLKPNFTETELKKAYRRLANEHHPDHGGSNEEMQKINAAYEVLSDNLGKTTQEEIKAKFSGIKAYYNNGNDYFGLGYEVSKMCEEFLEKATLNTTFDDFLAELTKVYKKYLISTKIPNFFLNRQKINYNCNSDEFTEQCKVIKEKYEKKVQADIDDVLYQYTNYYYYNLFKRIIESLSENTKFMLAGYDLTEEQYKQNLMELKREVDHLFEENEISILNFESLRREITSGPLDNEDKDILISYLERYFLTSTFDDIYQNMKSFLEIQPKILKLEIAKKNKDKLIKELIDNIRDNHNIFAQKYKIIIDKIFISNFYYDNNGIIFANLDHKTGYYSLLELILDGEYIPYGKILPDNSIAIYKNKDTYITLSYYNSLLIKSGYWSTAFSLPLSDERFSNEEKTITFIAEYLMKNYSLIDDSAVNGEKRNR